jgi:hypothetical protein
MLIGDPQSPYQIQIDEQAFSRPISHGHGSRGERTTMEILGREMSRQLSESATPIVWRTESCI